MNVGMSLLKVRPEEFATAVSAAEDFGFESIWLGEHLVFTVEMTDSAYPGAINAEGHRVTVPVRHPSPQMAVFDAPAALCYLAGMTKKIRFGTYVYLLGLRHPLIAARAFQTLDWFSGGRAEIGVGVGWLKGEFRTMGRPWSARGRLLDEALGVCKRLWSEDIVEHHGEFFDFEPVAFEPKPVQKPWPPILVGGETDAALRRLARHGDGWITMEHSPETYPRAARRMRQVLESEGRDPASVSVSVVGSAQSPDDLARWAELGVDRLIVTPWGKGEDRLTGMERFATDILQPAGATWEPSTDGA
jgi:probable F420-dependent oxidoreductase